VDVRIVTSTNQPLEDKIARGEFREDFFYRINVLPIHLPPLRERREDIPLIASHLLARHCAALGKPLKRISADLLQDLCAAHWKGNVRELENQIIRGIMFSSGNCHQTNGYRVGRIPEAPRGQPPEKAVSGELAYRQAKERTLKAFNESYIGNLLGGRTATLPRPPACAGWNASPCSRSCGATASVRQRTAAEEKPCHRSKTTRPASGPAPASGGFFGCQQKSRTGFL
jgi:DNA-binding NtrC family response regulator